MTGRHAVYTLIQCTPLLVEKAGVAPDMTFGITTHKQERVQARDPLRNLKPVRKDTRSPKQEQSVAPQTADRSNKKFKKKKKKGDVDGIRVLTSPVDSRQLSVRNANTGPN